VLGPRPIDLHIAGLEELGARFYVDHSRIVAGAHRVHGGTAHMSGERGSTVLGTANVMAAACRAEGKTVIKGAAREPELQDLARFLTACGADIEGAGTDTITVSGVPKLTGTEFTLMPDRIEAGTFMAAALATGGEVSIEGIQIEHVENFLGAFKQMGAAWEWEDTAITVYCAHERVQPADLVMEPHPGLPTDLQPQFCVVLCTARGSSVVRDTVYPERFTHVETLRRMGAHILAGDGRATIEGVDRLKGTEATAADLRAGAALIVAALAAQGRSTIRGLDHVDRGYQKIERRLAALGADIERRTVGQQRMRA
jgi:UDP-N-acetylglucosamine 1-carboxyvinyltransferase